MNEVWLHSIKEFSLIVKRVNLALVSKELNHLWGNRVVFRDWAPGTLTGGT